MDRVEGSAREASASGDLSASVAGLEVPWWLVLLQGVAAVLIGLLLVTQPGATLFTLVIFLGVYWLVGGIFDLVGIFLDRTNWGLKLLSGFPLDDRKAERANPDLAGRPQVVSGTTQLLFGGMHRLQENAVINVKNHSHSVTAEIEVPKAGAQGVIIAQGGDFGGWSLYVHEGRLRYAYNFVGVQRSYVGSETELKTGTHQARMEFAYDGGGIGKGGTVSLYVDGGQVGEGRVERTHKFFFSMDETADIGSDAGAPVSEDYGPRDNEFNGTVKWVQIDVDRAAEQLDHMIEAEERFHLAMAKQ
jgi:hypothetical protein